MKRQFMFMLMTVGMMMFTACGTKNQPTTPTPEPTHVDVTPAQKPNDTIPAPVDRDTAIQ